MASADYTFTTDDLESVKCAIMQIVAGERKVTITLGEMITQYQATQIKDLLALRAEIEGSLAVPGTTQATRRPLVYRSRYAKGL